MVYKVLADTREIFDDGYIVFFEVFCWADAGAIAKSVQSGKLNAVDVVEATLDRIASVDPKLGAFVTVGAESARAAAKSVDAKRAAGDPLGPLASLAAHGPELLSA